MGTEETRRRQVESPEHEREEQFRAIFSQAAVGIAQVGVDGNWLRLNNRFCEMLGYSEAELLNKNWLEISHPDDRETALAGRLRLLAGEITSHVMEKRYIRQDRTILWGRLYRSVVRDCDGRPKYLIAVLEDISEKIQADCALRESQQRLALALRAAQLKVWDCNLRNEEAALSPRFREVYQRDPLTRADWLALVHPADRERVVAVARESMGGTHQWDAEFRILLPGGSTRWVHSYAIVQIDEAEQPVRMVGVSQDITEHKQAAAAMRESEERFRRVFEEGPLGIALVRRDYRFLKVNRALCQMVGYTEEELTQKTFADITHPDDLREDAELAERLFNGEIPYYRVQKRYVKKNGELLWINLTASLFRDLDGQPPHGVAMVEDITEIKRTQEEALARQKLESVGALAGGIAHDFNNLLGAIDAQAELALEELDAGSSAREALKTISELAMRGSEIVRQLMIYAGKESEVAELINISEIVEQMLPLLRVSLSKHAVLTSDLDPDLPRTRATAAQFRQILMNLLTNASDAIGDRAGVIRVTTRRVRVGEASGAKSETVPKEDRVALEVSDTGAGMTFETQSKVFDPFFTTKSAGRGLGLAVVQGIVRNLGGTIHVASEPGRGTTFRILLSTTPSAAVEPQTTSEGARPQTHQSLAATVLIVEDEDALRQAVAKILRKIGAEVLETGNGSAAIDVLRTEGRQIDAILLDLNIPGSSSEEVLAEAMKVYPDSKVIVTSAYSEEAAAATMSSPSVRCFIRKPFPLGDLVQMLQNVLST